MRKIKFRGLRLDGNGWIYGSLIQSEIDVSGACSCDIMTRFAFFKDVKRYEVHQKTVGQFTGITDNHGAELFEGDIVTNRQINMIIEWSDDYCAFGVRLINGRWKSMKWLQSKGFYIVGNIHENTDLIYNDSKRNNVYF